MLQLKDFMPVNFLKKEKYTGSCKGMRFRMEKFEKEGADAPILRVSVWPEPYSFDCTPEEEKEFLECSFDADGIAKGVDWINERYESELHDGKRSAVCKNAKVQEKFLKNFCFINKILIFC